MKVKVPLSLRMSAVVSTLLSGTRLGAAFDQFVLNRYEAALPSPGRPFIPGFAQDARFDATAFTRWELARKVRYYFRNTWLLPRLAEEDVKYTCGPHGLSVTPASSDSEWNKRMDEAFQEWCESPFRDSSIPMSQGHRLLWKEAHMDGEVFASCTRLKMRGEQSKPAIELIESHRCSSPDLFGIGSEMIVDGVQLGLDANGIAIGRPAGYHIRDGVEGDTFRLVPAFNNQRPSSGGVIHIYDPERIGMYRAVTGYASILNQTADLELLAGLEMSRAKANAEDAKIFESWNGELPPHMQGTGSGSFLPVSGQPAIPGTTVDKELEKRVSQMRTILGSRIVAVRPGEKMNYPENPSPSAAQQWLWKLVIAQICTARSIPMMLVLPESIQGTVGRAVLDDAHLSFLAKFSIMSRVARQFYWFFADWARYNVPGLTDAPADWKRCKVTPPRACNVDKGKNTAANLASIAAGTRTYGDEAADDGTTAESRFRRKAVEIGLAKQIAAEVSKEMGVEVLPAEIIGNIADIAQRLGLAKQSSGIGEQAEAIAEKTEAEVEA